MQKSVLIVSGGSMGSLFSGFLKAASVKSGNAFDVVLRANWKEHREVIQKKGLSIVPVSDACKSIWKSIQNECNIIQDINNIKIPINAMDDSIFEKTSSQFHLYDMVLLFDKSYNTRTLAPMINSVLKKNGTCLTLQNGMGNVEILQSVLGPNRVIQGSTSQGATLLGPGTVKHAGTGYITIAAPTEESKQDASWWVKTLKSIHLDASLADNNFHTILWQKLLVNAVINSLTGLLDMKNGEILNYPDYDSIAYSIVKEGITVANKMQIPLDLEDCLKRVHLVAEQTASNTSSMLADILKKNRTEIDFINGYIAQKGKEVGVPTPTNELIVKLIHMKEEKGIASKQYICLFNKFNLKT